MKHNILNQYQTQIKWLHFIDQMTDQYAEDISALIADENKRKQHMLHKTAEEILSDSRKNGFFALKDDTNQSIVGYFGLMWYDHHNIQNQKIYERWSLIVRPECRGKWLGNILRTLLLEKYKNQAIFSVTNVPLVIKHNILAKENLIIQDNLDQRLKSIIEEGGPLLSDDVIFTNNTLSHLLDKPHHD